jgi:hypothetical protein
MGVWVQRDLHGIRDRSAVEFAYGKRSGVEAPELCFDQDPDMDLGRPKPVVFLVLDPEVVVLDELGRLLPFLPGHGLKWRGCETVLDDEIVAAWQAKVCRKLSKRSEWFQVLVHVAR